MPWLTVKIRVKTDDVRKGGAGGTVTRLCADGHKSLVENTDLDSVRPKEDWHMTLNEN